MHTNRTVRAAVALALVGLVSACGSTDTVELSSSTPRPLAARPSIATSSSTTSGTAEAAKAAAAAAAAAAKAKADAAAKAKAVAAAKAKAAAAAKAKAAAAAKAKAVAAAKAKAVAAAKVKAAAEAADVYYPNCSAVRAAGAAPILVGQPGYSRKLDRDGDGVACEN
jgi:colicin import membrane protein